MNLFLFVLHYFHMFKCVSQWPVLSALWYQRHLSKVLWLKNFQLAFCVIHQDARFPQSVFFFSFCLHTHTVRWRRDGAQLIVHHFDLVSIEPTILTIFGVYLDSILCVFFYLEGIEVMCIIAINTAHDCV